MGNKMKYVIIAMSFATILSTLGVAGKDSESTTEKINLRGYTLRLEECEGKCVVKYAGEKHCGELVLDIRPPCQFVRDYKSDPLSYTYEDAGNATVLVVVGAIGDSECTDPLMKKGCGTQTQGVILRCQGVSASKRIVKGSVWCPSKGIDEKEFWMFAHW